MHACARTHACMSFSRDHVCRYQLIVDNLKNRMGETSFLLLLYAATVGGYCRVPNECICRSGYSGATCQTGNCYTLEIFHMRICLAGICRTDYFTKDHAYLFQIWCPVSVRHHAAMVLLVATMDLEVTLAPAHQGGKEQTVVETEMSVLPTHARTEQPAL